MAKRIYLWDGTTWALVHDTGLDFSLVSLLDNARELRWMHTLMHITCAMQSRRDLLMADHAAIKMPGADSDHSEMADWEHDVHAMIAHVQRQQASGEP